MRSPRPASPYRRRRVIWMVILFGTVVLFYIGMNPDFASSFTGWSLPSYLKDIGGSSSSSHVSKVADAKADLEAAGEADRRLKVQEIHGLLHFVTVHSDRRLNEADGAIEVAGMGSVEVDPGDKVDLRVYSPDGDDDWGKHLNTLKTVHPLVVFSKSYCPFSQRAKSLLSSYNISPAPVVVEIDQRSDGTIIQSILARLTERRTVPNIIVQAESIGGSDEIHALHDQKKLQSLLEEHGLKVIGEVE